MMGSAYIDMPGTSVKRIFVNCNAPSYVLVTQTPLGDFHYSRRRIRPGLRITYSLPRYLDDKAETEQSGENMNHPKRTILDLAGDLMDTDLTELFGDFFGIDSMRPNKSVRVSKNAGMVEIEIDMPGSSKSDVSIDIAESNILRVEWKTPKDGTNIREFRIGRRADTDSIIATVTNGILKITIPSLPKPTDAKKIEVK
jgi:HSP20 family molecular chaperone IbpA